MLKDLLVLLIAIQASLIDVGIKSVVCTMNCEKTLRKHENYHKHDLGIGAIGKMRKFALEMII